jgi:hypothetical protein
MKNLVTRILTLGIALTAVAAVDAQTRLSAEVPFNFYVGSTPMPQGVYRIDENLGGVAWLISAPKQVAKAVTTLDVEGNKGTEPARLVFHCIGQECFLSQIWTGNGPHGRALPRSSREKELTQNGATPTLAVIRIAINR